MPPKKVQTLTTWQAVVIIALAESNMIVYRTAKKLGVHSTTITHHINAIQDKTGKDALNVNDIKDLLPLAYNVLSHNLESLRPRAKWVGEGMDARCGHCGEHPLRDMDVDHVWYWNYKPMFCPNCGAKMEE